MIKKKLARKLRTNEEIVKRTPLFGTEAWNKRKKVIAKKVVDREEKSRSPKQKRPKRKRK